MMGLPTRAWVRGRFSVCPEENELNKGHLLLFRIKVTAITGGTKDRCMVFYNSIIKTKRVVGNLVLDVLLRDVPPGTTQDISQIKPLNTQGVSKGDENIR